MDESAYKYRRDAPCTASLCTLHLFLFKVCLIMRHGQWQSSTLEKLRQAVALCCQEPCHWAASVCAPLRHSGLGWPGTIWIICLLPLQARCAGKRERALHTVVPMALLWVVQQGCDACEPDPPWSWPLLAVPAPWDDVYCQPEAAGLNGWGPAP